MNRSRHVKQLIYVAGVILAALMMWGCGKDETVAPIDESYIEALIIIPSPLSPRPGELTTLTLLVQGEGGWAEYKWEVEGGTLLSDQGIAVSWEPPDVTGTYGVRVIASLGALADTVQKTVMVSNYSQVPTGVEVNLQPFLDGEDLFFVGTAIHWLGFEPFPGFKPYVYRDSAVTNLNLLGQAIGGCASFSFHPAVDEILSTYINTYAIRQFPENIVVWDMLAVEAPLLLTNEIPSTVVDRANRSQYPCGSSDLDMIVWQHQLVNINDESGRTDTLNIEFVNRSLDEHMVLTRYIDSSSYAFFTNIRPMITPQEDYVLYFVDSTGVFEPCLIEISAGLPDTTKREALMVEGENYGIFEEAGIGIDETTIFEWRPVAHDIMAFINGDGTLCFFYPYEPNVQKLDDIGMVFEFAWAPDGEQFAVVTEEGISVGMTASGAVHPAFVKEKLSDDIFGIAWSPDPLDPKIAFRLVRKGRSSLESYSSLIIYSLNEDDWYFATNRVTWQQEIEVGYDMKRAVFESDNDGIYVPIPTADGGCVIYHSYR